MSGQNDSYPVAEVDELAKKAARLDGCIKGLQMLRDGASGRMQAINKQMDELKAEYNAIERTRSAIVDLLSDLTAEPKPPVPEITVTHVPKDPERTRSNPIARTPEKG